MALSYHSFRRWDMDDVAQWLSQIHLTNLIPNFERHGITGNDLLLIDEAFMKERLRISKPAEIMALNGAISNLIELAQSPQPPRGKLGKIPSMTSASSRDRTSSFEKIVPEPAPRKTSHSSTLPKNYTAGDARRDSSFRQPQLFPTASAQTLLDDQCQFSGWIRKQGGGYKSWKRRYMILRLGCLYYFSNETAAHPKGSFTLPGYRTEICRDPKITEKFKWTLKLAPISSLMRTYYVALGSKREMESWRSAIDEEINVSVKRAPTITANTLGSPISSPPMGDDHSDDDDDEDDNIYDDPEGGDVEEEDPYSQADDITTIYDKPDTDDDPYDEIDDGRILPPSNPLVKPQPHTSPSHGPGGPLAVRTFRGIDHWEVAPTHRVVAGKDGAPTVPMRSAISLGLDHGTSKPPGTGPTSSRAETGTAGARANHQAATEPSYLSLLRENSASGVAEPLDRTRLHSPPAEGRSSISEGSQLPKTIMRDGRAIVLPTVAEREDTDRDYEDDFVESNSNGEGPYDGDSDAYYIMFRKPEELMPPCCVFDTLDRDEANRLLRSNGRDGTYLIRSGRHSGTEKVLSVWHDDKCRHYKLFKSEAGRYSLTQGETFQTIPELLQYYALQSQLPKSDFYLSDAYHPTDH